MAPRAKLEPSKRGDVIALCAFIVTVAGVIGSQASRIGALEHSMEEKPMMIAQRNRENDAFGRRMDSVEQALRDCRTKR